MSTTTADITLQQILNRSNLNQLAAALSKVKLGNVLGSVKVTVAALTATATPQITGSAVRAASTTISGLDRDTNDNLPAIQTVKTLRVTTSGTANSVGSYAVSDAGGTALSPTAGANVGLALLSDDGTTLTFPTTVTGFVLEYVPRPDTALSTLWASGV
jgi:hypothetical protein